MSGRCSKALLATGGAFLVAASAVALLALPSQEPAPSDQPYDPTGVPPGFTFRTMDHERVDVLINGQKYGRTPLYWCFTPESAFDPKIELKDWPPEPSVACGTSVLEDEDGSRHVVELAIAGGRFREEERAEIRKKHPHLEVGEHVLYVNAKIRGKERRGGVRVKFAAADGAVYRHVSFEPASGDEALDPRLVRTIWIERD